MVEVIVVLVLLALAAAVVAPSLLSSHSESSELTSLVHGARAAAVRRGETVRLRIDQSGAWQAVAGTSPQGELLMSGQLSGLPADPTDLIFSPLGTCAPAIASTWPEALAGFDPLTCEAPPS